MQSRMSSGDKIKSFFITLWLVLVFTGLAALFVLNYNRVFHPELAVEIPDMGTTTIEGNRFELNVDTVDVAVGISDGELEELNIYNFPQGESPYMIYVEKGAHTLSVFGKDSYGLYTNRIATWYTATGNTDSLTPVGIFHVGRKEKWHEWSVGSYSPYSTVYSTVYNHFGGLYIHGPLYVFKNLHSVTRGSIGQIGTSSTAGCLRTEVEAAYFIYEMCPEGTIIKIVDGSPFGFVPYRNVSYENQTEEPNIEHFQLVSVAPDKIEFAEESHTMRVGEVYSPEIVTTPEYARNIDGVWSSNNPDILRVSGNVIWAAGTGQAMVYLNSRDGRLSASMLINVVAEDVDITADPPKVDGSSTEISNEDILANYQQIGMEKLELYINGKRFGLDESVWPLLKELGRNYRVQSYQSCAYVGMDRSYTYKETIDGKPCTCVISTVPLVKGEDNVCEISVRGGVRAELKTGEGIRVGDKKSDVEKVYGKYYTEVLVKNGSEDSYIRMTYWAGVPNKSGQPSLYFYLDPETYVVTGMGIYSGRNFV